MKTKSDNQQNPDCSSSIQMLLDMLRSCTDRDAIDHIRATLDYLNNHKIERDKTDTLFASHQYPSRKLTFCKINKGLCYDKYLTANASVLLYSFINHISTDNMVQVSMQDIITYTSINSVQTVRKALADLKQHGCIATVRESTSTSATVYMVNPAIVTCGKSMIHLQDEFWTFAGSDIKSVWLKENPGVESGREVIVLGKRERDALQAKTTWHFRDQFWIGKYPDPVTNKKPSADGTTDGKSDTLHSADTD